ncbi:MAG: hypothetical protein EBR82_56255 [Caulobacteraceae bacterium]|nr:hypothetical protein [Caulobacteraceae bacterium]
MKIDDLAIKLLLDGKITIQQAAAIGAAVRYTNFTITDEQKKDFISRYGEFTAEGLVELCGS